MKKMATVAFVLLATSAGHADVLALDGKAVPLLPKLTWGLSQQAALSRGLETYTKQNAKTDVIGLRSVTIGEIDFSVQAVFSKKDINEVKNGLNYVVLQHDGFVPRAKYEKFIRLIKSNFLYAGRASAVDESAVFYNSMQRDSYLVVTTSDRAIGYLNVAIAPGMSK